MANKNNGEGFFVTLVLCPSSDTTPEDVSRTGNIVSVGIQVLNSVVMLYCFYCNCFSVHSYQQLKDQTAQYSANR